MSNKTAFAILSAVGAGLIGLTLFLTLSRHTEGVIERMYWRREITLERVATVRESDWEVPTGGRLVSQSQKFHHYRQDLEPCFGIDEDGDITVDYRYVDGPPVYREWFQYDIERWVHSRLLRASGAGLGIRWPAYELAASNQPFGVGAEREPENARTEHYRIEITSATGSQEFELSPADYLRLEPGQAVLVAYSVFGNVRHIEPVAALP